MPTFSKGDLVMGVGSGAHTDLDAGDTEAPALKTTQFLLPVMPLPCLLTPAVPTLPAAKVNAACG
jgi:hypothetical protein